MYASVRRVEATNSSGPIEITFSLLGVQTKIHLSVDEAELVRKELSETISSITKGWEKQAAAANDSSRRLEEGDGRLCAK